jgi:hypothetical protein
VDFALFEDVAARPLRHRLHVTTDAKEVARAGQDHDVDGVIVGQVVPDGSKFADQLLIDGVACLRPVQAHRRDLVRDLDFQAFVSGVMGHIFLRCFACSSADRAALRYRRIPGCTSASAT